LVGRTCTARGGLKKFRVPHLDPGFDNENIKMDGGCLFKNRHLFGVQNLTIVAFVTE
jgi:hypothetical protein